MSRIFGTDGIRGTVGKDLTIEFVTQVGKALTYFNENEVYIGYDTRISNHLLADALAKGALSQGISIFDVGVITTPGLAYYAKKHHKIAVMITASHNPYIDNGIKILCYGNKMSDLQELEMEKYIVTPLEEKKKPGKLIKNFSLVKEEYVKYLKSFCDKQSLKIALDCAHGSTSEIAPEVFSEITNSLLVIGNSPTGTNINDGVGSTHLDTLSLFVKEQDYDIGFAFDGDGDRLLVVGKKGKKYSGDEILYVLASALHQKGKLNQNTVVMTIMSNLGIIQKLKEEGIHVSLTSVGDRNVLQNMLEHDYILGGENSGHIIHFQYMHTGDGIVSSLILLNLLKETGKTLEELTSGLIIFKDKMVNLKVKDKSIAYRDSIQNKVKEIQEQFCGEMNLIVRASGTENLIRVSCCAKNEKDVDQAIQMMVEQIKKEEEQL